MAAARPPWASGVAPPPIPSLLSSSTRRPWLAAVSAAVMPAAPEPSTTTSVSRAQRSGDRGSRRNSAPVTVAVTEPLVTGPAPEPVTGPAPRPARARPPP